MKIAFLDVLGLRYDGNTADTKGIGGSESAVIYLGRELDRLGFDVTVYNNCENEGTYDNVKYLDISRAADNSEDFDIIVVSRTPIFFSPIENRDRILKDFGHDIEAYRPLISRSKYKVLWMHDNFVLGEEWLETLLVDNYYDELFTLSDWQTNYVPNARHGQGLRHFEAMKRKMFQTRNGVRSFYKSVDLGVYQDENGGLVSTKDRNLFVYNSSITKGMVPLLDTIWPRVHEEFPEAKLVVIGGYYPSKDSSSTPDKIELLWRSKKNEHNGNRNVTFTGIISQKQIASILVRASYMIYPGAFPETFSIAATEALNYNVPLITTRFGALEETAPEQTSYLIDFPITMGLKNYNTEGSVADEAQVERFLDAVRLAYTDDELRKNKMYAANEFKPFLGWDTVALQWKHHFYHKFGMFMPLMELKEKVYRTQRLHSLYNRRFFNEEDMFEDYSQFEKNDIIVITPVFNAREYISKNIMSVAGQLYNHYHQIIIDDMSTDDTYQVALETINSLPVELQEGFTLIRNTEKRYALGNQIHALRNITGNPIIVLLDGDDWLKNDPYIFEFINREHEMGARFTYGSFVSLGEKRNYIAQEYPDHVHYGKSYRKYRFSWGLPYTHLRTFRKDLFDSVDDSEFRDKDGNYWRIGGDNAMFYPLIEKCEKHEIKALQKVMVVYNDLSPINDFKINRAEQQATASLIRGDISEQTAGNIPTKAYIIRNSENQNSIEYSITAAESCQRIGLPYEFVEGYYYKEPDELWSSSDIVRDYRREMIKPDASCNASHIKVWQKIAENKETAVILEHDGIMLQPIDIPIPDHKLVVLGYKLFDKDEYDYRRAGKPNRIVDISKHFGCHAYAMTHKTAEFLLDELRNDLRMTTSIDSTYFIRFKHNSEVPTIKFSDLGEYNLPRKVVDKVYIIRNPRDEISVERAGILMKSCAKLNRPVEFFDAEHGLGSYELWEDGKLGVKSYCTEMVPYNASIMTAHIKLWRKVAESGETALILEEHADLVSRYTYPVPSGFIVTTDNNNNNYSYALTSETARTLLDELGTLNVWDSIDMIYFNKRKMTSSIPLAIMDPTPAIGWVRKSTVWPSSWVENTPFLESFKRNLKNGGKLG